MFEPIPVVGVLEMERKMANKLSPVLVQIAKLLFASKRGRNLVQHGDLARQFALVAPLGGGAVIALQQALRLSESDHASPSRRGRPSWDWAVSSQA